MSSSSSASTVTTQVLDEHDIAVPIGVLDNELDPGYRTIKRALEDLEDYGFVKRDEDYTSHFRITEKGRKYLAGDLDASDLKNE